tara:strand:+ start:301 stop:1473 length:1173 start_codon:yes stop_codon:yes gene_type:complete
MDQFSSPEEAIQPSGSPLKGQAIIETFGRILTVLALLFTFLVGVKILTSGIKLMGGGFAQTLFDVTSNPLLSLLSGMLATALLQSSSTTTSIIVGLVSGGALNLAGAIPMIMGANLGTSVTNTLVSLAYLKDKDSFQRSFAAATVHDFFNILSVLVLLPLELATGILEKLATSVSAFLYGNMTGLTYSSPLKAAIKPLAKGAKTFITQNLGLEGNAAGIGLMLLGAGITIIALTTVVKVMKVVIERNKGDIIEKLLSKNPYTAILFGGVLTFCVQSSSITTSLLVPMAGSGLLSIASILPVTLGANIGTTTTALLAALTGNSAGLAIALVHFFFNILGILIWFPAEKMRRTPIILSTKLGKLSAKNKMIGFLYIGVVFFGLPLIGVFITN